MSADQKNNYFNSKDTSMVMLNVEPLSTPSKGGLAKNKEKSTGTK